MKNNEKKKNEKEFYKYYDTPPEDIKPFTAPVPKEVQEFEDEIDAMLDELEEEDKEEKEEKTKDK